MNPFPIPAADLLPHAPPMLCIDALLSASATGATASAHLGPDHILLHAGALTRPGHVELAAQTAGAMKGFAEKQLGLPVKKGFLAAAQDFSFLRDAKEVDTLRITVALTAEVAGVSLLEAAIYRETAGDEPELLSKGKLKVFVPESAVEA
jgi:predicted hotdog family 3-hydroxylacyl-ACP dehydratase